MEFALLGVIAVVTIVAVAAFSNRLGVAAPLILVLVGIGYSYIPGVPAVPEFPPELILTVVLPPLLYSAAIAVPVIDFRRNLGSITALSVLLVLVSSFVTGFVLFVILPNLTLPAAIAVGAVISPTDVVAATSIGKKLGLPPRLVTILEGEGLVNDATALVLLRSAVAVLALGSGEAFSVWGAVGDFAYAVVIAIIVGLIVGVVTVYIRSKLHDSILDTAISFAVPFIAFIPAEELHASGVVAVVVAGLYTGSARARHFTPQARISERLNWRTLQFILENGVFLLMGLQLKAVVTAVNDELSLGETVGLGILSVVLLTVIRFVFMGPLFIAVRRRDARGERSHQRLRDRILHWRASRPTDQVNPRQRERLDRMLDRRQNDVTQLQAEGLGWRGGLVAGWAGMRGVVTVAAAQSLPEGPYRSQLILIAFTVAVVTLLVQGGTLPIVIGLTGIRGSDRTADRRELATLLDEMTTAGVGVLDNPTFALAGEATINQEIVDRVRADTLLSAESAWERAEHGTGPEGLARSPHQQYRALRREVLAAEREVLLDATSRGAYPSRIITRAQSLLDLEETRLEQIDSGGRSE